jgi:hypothetical protein
MKHRFGLGFDLFSEMKMLSIDCTFALCRGHFAVIFIFLNFPSSLPEEEIREIVVPKIRTRQPKRSPTKWSLNTPE